MEWERDLVDCCGDIGEVGGVICGRLHLIEGVCCIEADCVAAKLFPKGLHMVRSDLQLYCCRMGRMVPQACKVVPAMIADRPLRDSILPIYISDAVP